MKELTVRLTIVHAYRQAHTLKTTHTHAHTPNFPLGDTA
jgi:hypothetical protein